MMCYNNAVLAGSMNMCRCIPSGNIFAVRLDVYENTSARV